MVTPPILRTVQFIVIIVILSLELQTLYLQISYFVSRSIVTGRYPRGSVPMFFRDSFRMQTYVW